MRVRITKALTGSIDGIQLSRLSKGQVYDVYTSLACYLLSEEVAEPAADDAPAVVPLEKHLFQQPAETRRRIVVPRSLAADRGHRKKKNPKQTGH